jgi:thiamine biosynthesis protein ThiS
MKVTYYSVKIIFNGQAYKLQLYKIMMVSDIIKFFGYQKNLIIIESNGKIFNNPNWSLITIRSNDQVEIITIVGGG